MFRDWLERVRSIASGARAWEDVRAVSRFHRIQSSPGYDAAAAWLEQALLPLGLEVRRETVPGDGLHRCLGELQQEAWSVEHAQAWLRSGDAREPLCDFAGEPLSIVQRTDSCHGRFRLVAVPDSLDPAALDAIDVRGAFVLSGASARRGVEQLVRARGAAGLLCDVRRLVDPVRTSEDDLDSLAYTSFWWEGDEQRAVGLVVTPRAGAALRQRLARGEQLELDVDIRTQRYAAPIPLVTAHLPGRTANDVLVLAHLCHPLPGAHDNGSGVAAALETARVVAELGKQHGPFERGIRFLWMPELTGTFAWLANDPQRIERLSAALNLDMVGADQSQCGSTFLLEHPPHFAASFAEELVSRIRAEALDWVLSYSGPGHMTMMRLAEVPYSGGSDHAVFVDPSIGVPCPMLIQWPDRYYHSSYDTADRIDPRSLELTVRIAATYALSLASAGEREARELTEFVERGARRRLLAAADQADPVRPLTRERLRGRSAIRSLARLGMRGVELESAVGRFESFADAECPHDSPRPRVPADTRIPERLKRGPLDFIDYLNAGWGRLSEAEQSACRDLSERCPDPVLELAWFAADGRRSVTDIAFHVELETGREAAAEVGEFYELTTRMGLSRWRNP